MIGIFLDPYPEEILYSTIARNATSLNYPNLRSVGITYFGDPHVIATAALPCRLEYLVTHLLPDAAYTVDTFIEKHTMLPFFAPFLPPARVTRLRSDMHGTHGMGVHMRAGIMASTVPMPDTLRLCPACAEEDRKQYGEWFWHRQHQVPSVYICPKHQVWLEVSSAQLANRQTRHAYITAERIFTDLPCSRPILKTPRDSVFLTIAQSVQWLLERNLSPLGLEHLRERYLCELIRCNLATFAGRVRMSEVQETFTAFYPEEVLASLHCNLDIQSQDNWLARLVRKPDSALHPLHHLLLMHFLGRNMADYLLTPSKPQGPFGNGPWPCLNPVCSYYKTCIIKTCTITYPPGVNGRPSGTFACTCGFTYGRAGPDKEGDDIYRRSKIITMGEVWENALKQYWTNGSFSLRSIAKLLGADPSTVKRYVQQLGLSRSPIQKYQEVVVTSHVPLNLECSIEGTHTTLNSLRLAWQEACNAYGLCGIKAVRQQIPQVYTWLYRHDRNWLEQHLPPRKRAKPAQRIDWTTRDKVISQLIPEAVQRLLLQPGPPRRVTLAAIGRSIRCLAMIQQHLDHLPLTALALAEAEESRIAFAIRRIQWVSTHWQDQERLPKLWELARLSGVERLLSEAIIQDTLNLAIDRIKG